jgi:UDP-GlcNAc:undecaprenyl-phosphate GlcNAc-1-phosphate transferase
MITNLTELFQDILITLILTISISPMMIWVSKRVGLVDRPGSALHKTHSTVTPLAGGLVMGLVLATYLLLVPLKPDSQIKGILLSTYLMIIIGIGDDLFNLKPLYKLLGQMIAASTVIFSGVQVHITQINSIDLLISYIWLIGITNAFNFIDSMDGLAVGLAGIISAFFMLVTIDAAQAEYAILSAVILGMMIGAFTYTSPPARMFLGDSGSQSLGILLASIGIAYTPGQAGLPQGSTWFVPILALSVPIFDMVLVVGSRIIRRKPIYKANTDHIYHRLVALHMHPTRAVTVMHIAAILSGLVAFLALRMEVLTANVVFGCVLILCIGLFLFLEKQFPNHQTQADSS